MLTGDKIETAKCIAISTGLKSKKESIFEMINVKEKKDLVDQQEIIKALEEFSRRMDTHMLMITGTTLDVVLANLNLCERFFNVAKNANSVCVCRCSPM